MTANHWLLELFHGPTLAFKDLAMQLLSRLMDWALARRGARATVLCATSGDTGGAAIEAFRSSSRASIFVFHPHNRVSEVQRRQMTTVLADNVHNIAVEGTFDDCQALVKAMFNDRPFRDRLELAAVNSINWARIVAQVVYYVTSALSLGAPERAVRFTVPTGNFGNIFAGLCCQTHGAAGSAGWSSPATSTISSTAHLSTGRYEVHPVTPSSSPSMDIQVSSNFERLLFEVSGRNPTEVVRSADRLARSAGFDLTAHALAAIRADFCSGHADEASVLEMIRTVYQSTGRLIDPHTAVGYVVASRHAATSDAMVILATAHPAKFPDSVEKASGVRPALPGRPRRSI